MPWFGGGSPSASSNSISSSLGRPFVPNSGISVHLADILMRQLAGLEIDQHEALEQVVAKDEVHVEVLVLEAHALLPGDEGEAADSRSAG